MATEIMTAQQAASYLQLGVDTLKRKARTGEIPGAKVGRGWRFLKRELDAWLEQGGSRYEQVVDQSLAEEAQRRLARGGRRIPLAEAKARFGL